MYSHPSVGGAAAATGNSATSTAAQQRRQGSARHPPTGAAHHHHPQQYGMGGVDHRAASNSASRQQQQQQNPASSNLNLMSRPTAATGHSTSMSTTNTKSPANQGSLVESRGSNATVATRNKINNQASGSRQQSLNLSSNQFLKSPATSAPQTTKNTPGHHHQHHQSNTFAPGPVLGQDQFLFSASSPPVQINKQAIMINSVGGAGSQLNHNTHHHQQQLVQQVVTRPIQGKQKESLGHITASRRQKQSTGLQINVEGCQSIVINSPSRGHVVASPSSKMNNIPDNILFYGQQQQSSQTSTTQPGRGTNTTVSPSGGYHHQHSNINLDHNNLSPKAATAAEMMGPGGHTQAAAHRRQQHQQQQHSQQHSALSKKQLRQKVVSGGTTNAQYHHHHGHVTTPKGASQAPSNQFDQMVGYSNNVPRSTKARSSQHFVKGRFIDPNNTNAQKAALAQNEQQQEGIGTTQQVTMSTLEQQKQQKLKKGYSPRRDPGAETTANGGCADEAAQMLFMQRSPQQQHHAPPRKGSNHRLVSPTHGTANARSNAHSSYNNRGSAIGGNKHLSKTSNTAGSTAVKQQNSSLGFKSSGGTTQNTLKIQNVRVYNETTAGVVGQKVGPATTKHESSQHQRYAMRNNFLSPSMGEASGGRPIFTATDRKDQMARHGGGSNLRHFSNQSSSSVNHQSAMNKQHQTKKRKLTLNQRSTVGKNGSLNNSGIMGVPGQTSMRPMSGAVKGSNRGHQHTYSLRTNVAYVSALNNTNPQMSGITSVNSSQRQSTAIPRGKNIQILQTETTEDLNQQQRVYSPNAAMNGRRDINQELQNLVVPQFYPQTTTNSTAPRYIQFSQPSSTQETTAHNEKISQNRSCLIDEPGIAHTSNDDIHHMSSAAHMTNSLMHMSQDQQHQIASSKPLMSSSGLSMEHAPSHQHYISSNTQHTVGSLRRQSRHLEDISHVVNDSNAHNASELLLGTQNSNFKDPASSEQFLASFDKPKSTGGGVEHNQNHPNQQHSRQSIQFDNSEVVSKQQPPSLSGIQQLQPANLQFKPPSDLHSNNNDLGGPLVIPNFAINLPQTTTAATAPKISSDNMLMEALDPISKNSKDINQKLQQRKMDSARRPDQNHYHHQQTNTHQQLQSNQTHNLQVVVTHELNPVVGLSTFSGAHVATSSSGSGLGSGTNALKQAQTTKNNAGNMMIPSLNFNSAGANQTVAQHQKQQSSYPDSGASSSRPSCVQQKSDHQSQSHHTQQTTQQSARQSQAQVQQHHSSSATQRSNHQVSSTHRSAAAEASASAAPQTSHQQRKSTTQSVTGAAASNSNTHRSNHAMIKQQQQQQTSSTARSPQQQHLTTMGSKSGKDNGSNAPANLTQVSPDSCIQQQQQFPNKSQHQASSKGSQGTSANVTMQLNQSSARASRQNLQAKDSQRSDHHQQQFNQQIKLPMTPAKCLKLFGHRHLTEYEKTEILDFPQVYYFGEGVKKIQAQRPAHQTATSPKFGSSHRESSKNNRSNNSQQNEEDTNFGYDDSKGNYRVVMKDHIAYRYEMVEPLGRGSFGIAIKCFDHKTQDYVAVKIIKNKQKYYYQAGVELKILQYLKENDPDDTMNIIHMKDYVIFRKHLCITFELMSINLYEFLKLNDFEGLTLSLVRRFAIQLLYSLKFLKENDVIHCDLKPENILLKDPSKSGIKIIDFGSSCFQDERVYTYIQSRFYRAPEIILGIKYTPCIDMWSFGCIMAEFAMGYPIFPGEDETDQISLIMEVCGIPQPEVLAKGQRKTKFFNENNMPKLVPNSQGKVRKPGTKVLDDILDCSDQSFVNFVERCLEWDPDKRMTPDEAIRHQWILEGLPPKVLVHHQKLHNITTKSLPPHIREQRAEYLATQPLDVQEEFRDDDEEFDEASQSSSYQPNGRNTRSLANQGPGASNPKSKSLDRTAGGVHHGHTHITTTGQGQGQNFIVKNHRNSAHAGGPSNQHNRSHRQAQSFDQSASGYHRHNNNTSANINAQQHHNTTRQTKKPQQQQLNNKLQNNVTSSVGPNSSDGSHNNRYHQAQMQQSRGQQP